MSEPDEISRRLVARRAYLGVRDRTPTPDLLPTRTMPFALTLSDCRDVAAHLVALVRDSYVQRRRHHRADDSGRPDRYGDRPLVDWDGGYDWQGRYHPPVWARIAQAALDRGFDVVDYVEKAFDLGAGAGSPQPNKLLSAPVLDTYDRTHMGTVVEQRRVNRSVMESYLVTQIFREMGLGLPRPQAALAVLRNPTNSLRPFFRYWIVAQFDLEQPEYRQIWAIWRRPALLDYAASVRAHEAVYDDPILESFRSVVSMARRALAEIVAGDPNGWVEALNNAPGSGPAGAPP